MPINKSACLTALMLRMHYLLDFFYAKKIKTSSVSFLSNGNLRKVYKKMTEDFFANRTFANRLLRVGHPVRFGRYKGMSHTHPHTKTKQ